MISSSSSVYLFRQTKNYSFIFLFKDKITVYHIFFVCVCCCVWYICLFVCLINNNTTTTTTKLTLFFGPNFFSFCFSWSSSWNRLIFNTTTNNNNQCFSNIICVCVCAVYVCTTYQEFESFCFVFGHLKTNHHLII